MSSTASPSALFVYYKVPHQEHGQYLPKISLLTQEIQSRWPHLRFQVMQRPESSADGLETWMEIYTHTEGITLEMVSELQELAVRLGLPAKRASEFFIPLALY